MMSAAPTAWTASASAAATTASATRTIAIAATVVPSTFWTARASARRCCFTFHSIKVRLIVSVEIRAAFDHRCGLAVTDWRGKRRRFRYTTFRIWRRRSPAHLGALLFQNRLARQLDAIAFDGQYFDQHLVAFLKFVLDVFDSVLCNFADVQQAVSAWNDLDEGSKLRQPRDFAKIGLPYFRSRGQVADDLKR